MHILDTPTRKNLILIISALWVWCHTMYGQDPAAPFQKILPGGIHLNASGISCDTLSGTRSRQSNKHRPHGVIEGFLNQGMYASAEQLFEGRLPGLMLVWQTGQPGGAANLYIRGINSIRISSEPLFIVDGIPLDGRSARAATIRTDLGIYPGSSPLNFLNTQDIESIRILKGGYSASRYGLRGANGVVIIETKNGGTSMPGAVFSTGIGINQVQKKYDVLTAGEYRRALNDYGLSNMGDGKGTEDAQEAIFQNALSRYHDFSIAGRKGGHKYRLSIGLQDFEGVVKESGMSKYHFSFNNSNTFFDDRVGMKFAILSSHTNEEIVPISTNAGFAGSLIGQALQWNPTIPLVQNGEFTNAGNNQTGAIVGGTTINPLQLLDASHENAHVTTILASISPYWNIRHNIRYRYRYGVHYSQGTSRAGIKGSINVQGIQGDGFAAISKTDLLSQIHAHTLEFHTGPFPETSLQLEAGYEYQTHDYRGERMSGRGFSVPDRDNTTTLQNSDARNRLIESFADPIIKLQALYGMAAFQWKDTYVLNVAARHEGSSKLGKNNRYMTFPGLRFAWIASNESFLASEFLNKLALWIDWGKTGNQGFPAGAATERYRLNPTFNNPYPGIQYVNTSNPDLKAETSTSVEIGLDFGFCKNKLSGQVNFFRKATRGLLLDPFITEPGPIAMGWRNIDGKILNNGIDIQLTGKLVEKGNTHVSISGFMTYLSHKLTEFSEGPIFTGNLLGAGVSSNLVQVFENEKPLLTFFTSKFIGLDEHGKSQYANNREREFFGNPIPGFLFGI